MMKYEWVANERRHEWTFAGNIGSVSFQVPDCVSGHKGRMVCDAAMVLGFKQKIANGAAIPHNVETGKAATDAEKRAAMLAIVARLNAGEWNAERTGGKPKLVDVTALVAVIAAKLGKPSAGVRAYVEAKDEAGRRAIAESAQFAESYVLQVAKMRPTTELSAEDEAELDAILD